MDAEHFKPMRPGRLSIHSLLQLCKLPTTVLHSLLEPLDVCHRQVTLVGKVRQHNAQGISQDIVLDDGTGRMKINFVVDDYGVRPHIPITQIPFARVLALNLRPEELWSRPDDRGY